MILADSAIAAFQASAGISPDRINLFIRTVLLTITILWAAWCVHGAFEHFSHHDMEVFDLFRKNWRALFIVMLMMGLVFI